MDCSMPGFPVLHHLLELAQTHVHWISNAIQPSYPLSSPSPPAFSLSSIQHQLIFPNELALPIRWPKYWSFSFSKGHSNVYLGLISFRINWFDLLAIQWTSKSLLQHHSSKASILWCSDFFMVQLSHPHHSFDYTDFALLVVFYCWTFSIRGILYGTCMMEKYKHIAHEFVW